jgi:rod shape-determining protein MreC
MNRHSLNRRIILIVAAGAVLVIIGLTSAKGPLEWAYNVTLAPLSRSLAGMGSGISATMADVGRVSRLARDNAGLVQENAQLRQRLAADAETRRDNELLRQQLGLEVAGTSPQVAAEVVAFHPDSYRQFITISKGSADGIKLGQAVLSEGVLAGLITSVNSHDAKVILVVDPEFKLAAKVQGDNAADGIIQGQLGGGLVMQKIDQTKQIRPGDTVTTSGLGGEVPAGLLIGQVQSVDNRTNVIFQSAQISTPLVPNQLRFVFVETP